MEPKPKHLGAEYASQFQDAGVVESYRHRPEYPADTFRILSELVQDEPRSVLDVGCGTGYVARALVGYVDSVDAVDFSERMIVMAKSLPNGNHSGISWLHGPVEEVPLTPPYALITAGNSLGWMDWHVVFPRFKESLTPNGYLALVGQTHSPVPWNDDLMRIIQTYSTNRDYAAYSLVDELQRRGLFSVMGTATTEPVPFWQPIHDYIESFHARNGFSRESMTEGNARAFDDEAAALVSGFCPSGEVVLWVLGTVVWGKPT